MDWVILIAAGVMEAGWATALSASRGFKRLWPTVIFVVTLALSMWGLAHAMLTIPVGTAYAVWVGIGAVLTVVVSILRGEEKLSTARLLLLLGLVGCVVGLKVVG
ncbi:multidrug efflux SMR transporter [Isoptericola sp. BMS4]|uniref:DMT family transporter n=1 Tax=Isoptericola sp. BMS4 TaxID=2527875 RepID=UPI00142080CB|nr:multidrug efflux SMR transporter [Isoptericola sp. BMS4]